MVYILIATGLLVCAIQSIRSPRMLHSALWLAGASALTALMLYMLGAPEVAVIELSVGAGLVTVLFVFAINISGEELQLSQHSIPQTLVWIVLFVVITLAGLLSLPALNTPFSGPEQATQLRITLWEDRSLDVLLQILLIFAGILGVLGLLSGHDEKQSEGKDL